MQSLVTLVGNIVKDVTVRETSGGIVANFRIACDNGYLDKRTKQWVERTVFFNVSAWRQLGENVAASVHSGQPVIVVGRLRQREFDRDGQRVTVIEVDADLVGHDLSRGSASFARKPRGPQTADLAREVLDSREHPAEQAHTTDLTGWAGPGLVVDPVPLSAGSEAAVA